LFFCMLKPPKTLNGNDNS